MNDQGFQHLLSSKFELSGESSVAAGPVGRHASAGTDWKMNTEPLTYLRSKGVFAGLTLEGAVVEQDNDSTEAIYGKDMKFRYILSGKASTPRSAGAFMKAVSNAGPPGPYCRSKRRPEVVFGEFPPPRSHPLSNSAKRVGFCASKSHFFLEAPRQIVPRVAWRREIKSSPVQERG